MRKHKNKLPVYEKPIPWLPIDSRIFSPFIKFDKVTGWAKFFIQVEITLSILIVLGTLFLALLKLIEWMM